jgi:hypothetical protein
MAGDAAHAESMAQDLNQRFPLDTQVQALWLPVICAQEALDRNNTAAIEDLQPASGPIEFGQTPFVANLSCLYRPTSAAQRIWQPARAKPLRGSSSEGSSCEP